MPVMHGHTLVALPARLLSGMRALDLLGRCLRAAGSQENGAPLQPPKATALSRSM